MEKNKIQIAVYLYKYCDIILKKYPVDTHVIIVVFSL